MSHTKPKEMDMSIQTTFADDRWHITIQAWLQTPDACDMAIRALEILKPLLVDGPAETATTMNETASI